MTMSEDHERLASELLTHSRKMGEARNNEKEEYLEARLIELFGSVEEGMKNLHLVTLEEHPTEYKEVVDDFGYVVYTATDRYQLRMKTQEELRVEGLFPMDVHAKIEVKEVNE